MLGDKWETMGGKSGIMRPKASPSGRSGRKMGDKSGSMHSKASASERQMADKWETSLASCGARHQQIGIKWETNGTQAPCGDRGKIMRSKHAPLSKE